MNTRTTESETKPEPETKKRKSESDSDSDSELVNKKRKTESDIISESPLQNWILRQKGTKLVLINHLQWDDDPTQYLVRDDFLSADDRQKLCQLHTVQPSETEELMEWFLEKFGEEDDEHYMYQCPIDVPVTGDFCAIYNIYANW